MTSTLLSNAGNAFALGAGAATAGGIIAANSLAAGASGPGGAAAATDSAAAAGPLGTAFGLGAASAGGLFTGPANVAGAALAAGMLYYRSHSALLLCWRIVYICIVICCNNRMRVPSVMWRHAILLESVYIYVYIVVPVYL